MKISTKIFIALGIALVVLVGFALYEWSYWDSASTLPAPAAQMPATSASTSSATVPTAANSTSPYPPPSLGEQTGSMQIDGQTLYVDLDVTEAQQALGLGNRAGLGADQGMLFIFPNDAQHEFWMKDMSFSIDMIWMSDDGTIIYIQPNVAPSTYPDAFGPNEVSRYVLEVPANYAAEHGIKIGDTATLP